MADLNVTVEGGEEIIQTLNQFGLDVERSLELICTAGAKAMQSQIEAKAPGSIGDDIVVKTAEKSSDRVRVDTGPSKKKWYAHFLERGTAPHVITPNQAKALEVAGVYRARANHPVIAARPFMRPAYDTGKGDAEKEIKGKVKGLVDRVK